MSVANDIIQAVSSLCQTVYTNIIYLSQGDERVDNRMRSMRQSNLLSSREKERFIMRNDYLSERDVLAPSDMLLRFDDLQKSRKDRVTVTDENLKIQRSDAGVSNNDADVDPVVVNEVSLLTRMEKRAKKMKVIIDSGASCHIFNNAAVFTKLKIYDDGVDKNMIAANGGKMAVKGVGHTCLVKDALWVPDCKTNIISISQLDWDGFEIMFGNGIVRIWRYGDINEVMTGTMHNNLYYLDYEYRYRLMDTNCNDYYGNVNEDSMDMDIPLEGLEEDTEPASYEPLDNYDDLITQINNVLKSNCERQYAALAECHIQTRGMIERKKGEQIQPKGPSAEAFERRKKRRRIRFHGEPAKNPLLQLHLSMGHLPIERILKAYKDGVIDDPRYSYKELKKYANEDEGIPVCPDCLAGGMRAFKAISYTDTEERGVLEKIAVDYKGPIKIRSRDGFNGFYLFSDKRSDYVKAYGVKRKAELPKCMERFWKEVVSPNANIHGEFPVRVWQSDYDKVQLSSMLSTWVSKHRGYCQSSSPHKKEHNGQVERDMQTIVDKARTVMMAYNVSPIWWFHAIDYACYTLVRCPTTKKGSLSPYELVTGRKPKTDHMIPFFCPGLYKITKEEMTGIWYPKARPCRMIGYDAFVLNGYILYDIDSMQVVNGRTDVIWDTHFIEEYVQKNDELVRPSKPIQEKNDNPLESEDTDETDMVYFTLKCRDVFCNTVAAMIFEEPVSTASENQDTEDRFAYDHGSEDTKDHYVHSVISSKDKSLVLPKVPKTIEEALNPDSEDYSIWWEAIMKELKQFEVYNIFNHDVPQEGHAMKTKFVFTVTFRSDFTVKYKARLVVCGYSQIKGLDYEETYAPTIPIISVMMMMRTAAVLDMDYAVCDVSAAFLEGEAEVTQYCRLPIQISNPDLIQGERVQIVGNMYGEKQAPKVWNDKANNILIGFGFERCPWDPCLYKLEDKTNGCIKMYMTIHVDDMLVCGDIILIKQFHQYMLNHVRNLELFIPSDEDGIKYIGMTIKKVKDNGNIYFDLCQAEYIEKMKLYPPESLTKKIIKVPMTSTINLRMENPNPSNTSLLRVTGSYRYLCDRTRPDLLVTTGELATGGADGPSDAHLKVARQAYVYLKQTKNQKLRLGGKQVKRLGKELHFYFSDAAFIREGNSKSRLGYAGWLGYSNGAYTATSINDTTVSQSSMESEVKALNACCNTIVHTRRLCTFLGYEETSTIIFEDNKAAIDLATTLKTTPKSRHIQPKINHIRERLNAGDIQILFIPSHLNVADTLTKPLALDFFTKHRDKLLHGFQDVDELFKDLVSLEDIMKKLE